MSEIVSDGDGYESASGAMTCTGCASVISLDAWSNKCDSLKDDHVNITHFLHSLIIKQSLNLD